jgi:hypothetical protein
MAGTSRGLGRSVHLFDMFGSMCSSPSGESCPFGYLKPASTGRTVNLVVLPFNYPVLHSLMAKLVKVSIYLIM